MRFTSIVLAIVLGTIVVGPSLYAADECELILSDPDAAVNEEPITCSNDNCSTEDCDEELEFNPFNFRRIWYCSCNDTPVSGCVGYAEWNPIAEEWELQGCTTAPPLSCAPQHCDEGVSPGGNAMCKCS